MDMALIKLKMFNMHQIKPNETKPKKYSWF